MATNDFGVASAAVLTSMSGVEFLRAIVAGQLPQPPICATLGFRLIEAEHGFVVFEGTPAPCHANPIGSIHGGYAATLLDSCMACAVHASLAAGQTYTTAEIKVNYVRALTDATGPVRAEGRLIHAGRRMATAEGRLVDASGRLYAHGTTTCLVFTPA